MSRSRTATCPTPRPRAGLLHSVHRTISSIGQRLLLASSKILHRRRNSKIALPYGSILSVPSALLVVGYSLNAIVSALNGGQMPVLWPGGCTPDVVSDGIHTCMTQATHLKIFADWIVMHDTDSFGRTQISSASIGDFLMYGYFYTRWPALIAWSALVINDAKRAFHATKRKISRRNGVGR